MDYPDSIKVLVVDDNAVNRLVALRILEKLSLSSDAVPGGREALEAMSAKTYDLVLMDIQMPEMSGIEVTHAIRACQDGAWDPDIPIIATTAHAMADDREACLAAGMDGYLAKPINRERLSEAIEEVMAKGRVSHTPADAAPNLEDESGPPIFEVGELREQLGNDEEICREVVRVFVQDADASLDRMREGLRSGDLKQVAFCAHALKGAGANVGAVAIRQLAFQIEKAAKEGRAEEVDALFPALNDGLSKFKDEAQRVGLLA